MEISVVIPVYGCPAALPQLHRRLTDTLSQITEEYEIILVNDACPKNSWEVISKICEEDSHVYGINLARNFGQIRAITAGLDASCGEWVVVMDCDLQDRPEEIRRLYDKAKEGYDAVFAKRKHRQDSKGKVFLSKIFYKIYSIATDGYYDPALCNFSICRRKMVEYYCSMRECHRAYVMYMKWLGFRQTEIEVEHQERYEGKSGYNLKKRLKMALEILTSQSDKFLKFILSIGIVMMFISVLMVIWVVVNYFINNILAGWTSIVASLFLVGGVIILCLGVTGLYVGNIFMQVKERPLYVIAEKKNANEKKAAAKEQQIN